MEDERGDRIVILGWDRILRAIRNVGKGSHSGTHCYVRRDDDALELGIFAHLEKCLRGLGLGPRALMPLG